MNSRQSANLLNVNVLSCCSRPTDRPPLVTIRTYNNHQRTQGDRLVLVSQSGFAPVEWSGVDEVGCYGVEGKGKGKKKKERKKAWLGGG